MKKILGLVLLYSILISPQSYRLGFDLEGNQVIVNNQNGNHILTADNLPFSLHMNVTYNLYKNLSIQAKIGRTLFTEFLGWEYGINARYIIYKPLFISAGILQHSNEGGGISNELKVSFSSILMLQTGIGIALSDVFSIELAYYIPTAKKIIDSELHFDSNIAGTGYYWEDNALKSMIRLNFMFGWVL